MASTEASSSSSAASSSSSSSSEESRPQAARSEASTEASSSSSAASSSSSSFSEESRPQAARSEAGPLPVKRGEIGYQEVVVKEEAEGRGSNSSALETSLPERHPADRDSPPSSSSTQTNTSTSPAVSPAAPTSTADDSSSASSLKKRKGVLSLFKRKKYGGIQLGTLVVFSLQAILIMGTIAAWAVAGVFLNGKTHNSNNGNNSDSDPNASMQSSSSSAIFVHVVFAIGFLSQCLFLERRIYVMRAQRYAHLHHGEMLPTSRRGRAVDAMVAFSPWNRPPLPTYAAALAQSGAGTGDVEDNLIAVVPPPAYGNTRGSRLLLAGFLDSHLRAQRPVSVRTETSQQDRPVSYASNDSEWEVIQDADRARQLEETLASLERPATRQSRR